MFSRELLIAEFQLADHRNVAFAQRAHPLRLANAANANHAKIHPCQQFGVRLGQAQMHFRAQLGQALGFLPERVRVFTIHGHDRRAALAQQTTGRPAPCPKANQ